ncbi:hypothetical protein A0H76_401 [Hepatospora eriocheir]|uniref:Uncharacterized protein n=1 Tax=Hepatospora eriocheir TaxID=1081669 RepID=A0A1X0QIU4_9MICR|nr:hypothetical protein A0H76_401 [Hepatospora eriocheir]
MKSEYTDDRDKTITDTETENTRTDETESSSVNKLSSTSRLAFGISNKNKKDSNDFVKKIVNIYLFFIVFSLLWLYICSIN